MPRPYTLAIFDAEINKHVCKWCRNRADPRPMNEDGSRPEYQKWRLRHAHARCMEPLSGTTHLPQAGSQAPPSNLMPLPPPPPPPPSQPRNHPQACTFGCNSMPECECYHCQGAPEDYMDVDMAGGGDFSNADDVLMGNPPQNWIQLEPDSSSSEDEEEESLPQRERQPLLPENFKRKARKGEAIYLKERHNEPCWETKGPSTAKHTVLEISYLLLVAFHERHFPVEASDTMLSILSAVMPDGALLPRTYDVLRKSLGYEGLGQYERHVCLCGQHVYDALPRDQWEYHRNEQCPRDTCVHRRFLPLSGGRLKPARRCYYFGIENAIHRLFASAEWVDSRPANYDEMIADKGSWWSSGSAKKINDNTGNALFDPANGAYSLGYDWVNLFSFQDHSVGMVYLRSEGHPDEVRSKRRHHLPVMLIPGPNLPESIDGCFNLIGEEFSRIGPLSGNPGVLVTPMHFKESLDVEIGVAGEANGGTTAQNATTSTVSAAQVEEVAGIPFYHKPILVFLYADTPARAKLLKSLGSAAAYLSCYWCWLTGVRLDATGKEDITHGTMVQLGYVKDVIPTCGHFGPELDENDNVIGGTATPIRMNTTGILVTQAQQDAREIAATNLLNIGRKDVAASTGCMGRCVLLDHLPYLSALDLFVLPLCHMLLLGTLKDFLRLAMGSLDLNVRRQDLEISAKAKRAMAAVEQRIILTGDFGRNVKAISSHKGWLIEHCITFIDCVSTSLFNDKVVGETVLPPVMKEGWNLLRPALMHYLRPHTREDLALTSDSITEAAHLFLEFGGWAERNKLGRQICKLNLHTACCRLPVQEYEMGQPMRYNECWVENMMQEGKSNTRGHTTSEYPEQTIAEGWAIHDVLQDTLRANPHLARVRHDAFKKIERNKNVDEGATDNDVDEAMLFTGEPPSTCDWDEIILPSLQKLARVLENLPPSWKQEWFQGDNASLFKALKPMVYTSAVIHSVSQISSIENKRERTRSSCFLQVRSVAGRGVEKPRPVRVQKLVLIRPPEEVIDAKPFRVALCHVYKFLEPLVDNAGGVLLRAHLTGKDTDFEDRNRAFDLKSFDRKLVTVAPIGRPEVGTFSTSNLGTGCAYFMTYSMTTGQGPL